MSGAFMVVLLNAPARSRRERANDAASSARGTGILTHAPVAAARRGCAHASGESGILRGSVSSLFSGESAGIR